MTDRVGKPAKRFDLYPHDTGDLAQQQAFMATRKPANPLAGGAKGNHVSRLQREIAAGLSNTGLDAEAIIAGMILGEHLIIDGAGDMQIVRIANHITHRYPGPARPETVGALGARVIDVIGISIILAMQVPPAIKLRARHITVIGHRD